eukprot:scaffold1060_cov385-Pavlova_lutheri.AAC.5
MGRISVPELVKDNLDLKERSRSMRVREKRPHTSQEGRCGKKEKRIPDLKKVNGRMVARAPCKRT